MKIKFSALMKSNRLFCDYVEDYSRVSSFFRGNPARQASYTQVIEDVLEREYHRERIFEILEKQSKMWNAGEATFRNLEKIKKSNCCVVVTGQQLGLFGGPLYTLYKTITCIRLSLMLEEKLAIPVVPLFWIESEDHDLLEATTISSVDSAGELQGLIFEPSSWEDGLSLSKLVLDGNVDSVIERLAEYLPVTIYKDEAISRMHSYFSEGARYIDAFASWMHHIFDGYGIIMVTPSDVELKRLAAPLFRKELVTSPSSSALLQTTTEELLGLGYHAQINPQQSRVNLYYHTPKRESLLREGSIFKVDSKELSEKDLLQLLDSEIENFSHNVILRPLVQDYLFPTLAYVAGPAEVAYWAQLRDLYGHFGIPRPLVYPRMSITILEGSIKRLLLKYDIGIEDLFNFHEETVDSKLKLQLPQAFQEKMNGAWDTFKTALSSIETESVLLDSNLRPAFRHFLGRTGKQWELLSRKVAETYRHKDEILNRHRGKILHSLFPNNGLQERALNIMQYYVKYERAFVDSLFHVPDLEYPWSHQIIEF